MWNYFFELEGELEYGLNLTLEELIKDIVPFDDMSVEQSDDELYNCLISECKAVIDYGTYVYIFFNEGNELRRMYPSKEEAVPILRKILAND